MINLPIVDDRLDIRVAGEWTKRQGYSFNEIDRSAHRRPRSVVGPRLASAGSRSKICKLLSSGSISPKTTIGCAPPSSFARQLRSQPSVGGVLSVGAGGDLFSSGRLSQPGMPSDFALFRRMPLKCRMDYSLPYYRGPVGPRCSYSSTASMFTQAQRNREICVSSNPRSIPTYKAKNDTIELNTDYNITPALTFTSQTGFNHDFLWSTEDYNRFNTAPGAFRSDKRVDLTDQIAITPDPSGLHVCGCNNRFLYSGRSLYGEFNQCVCQPTGVFCDPQLGCSDRLVAEDLSDEHAWQLSQEFRLASNFSGPLNFSVGGNYLHYETEENYYVFINTLTPAFSAQRAGYLIVPWPGVSDNTNACSGGSRHQIRRAVTASNALAATISTPIRSPVSTMRATIIF